VWRAYDTAGPLADRELSLRAADLANSVPRGPDGTARLALPPALREPYGAAPDRDIFPIRGRRGDLLAAMPDAFGPPVQPCAATRRPGFGWRTCGARSCRWSRL